MIDWDEIELAYRTGVMSDVDICEKYDIKSHELDNAVKTRGWTQEILTPEDEATVLGLAEHPRMPIDSLFSTDDIKRQALMTAGQIVRLHRTDINKMRGMSALIMEKLQLFIDTGEHQHLLGFVGAKDSATDLLEKLSRVLTRIVTLERQAYGLETLTIVPDMDEENQVSKDIKRLSEQLKQITQAKAQKAEATATEINTRGEDAEA